MVNKSYNKEMIKRFLVHKAILIAIYALTSLIIESFLFLYLGFGFLPEYWFLDVFIIAIIAFIVLFLPVNWFENILVCFCLFIQILLSYVNICIYNVLGDVFSFDMLSLVGETTRVLTIDMLPLWPIIFFLVLFAISITCICFSKKYKVINYNKREAFGYLIKTFALLGVSISFLMYSLTSTYGLSAGTGYESYFSDKVLYATFNSNKLALKKFGTIGFYFEEFFRQFYDQDGIKSYSYVQLLDYIESSEYDPEKLSLYGVATHTNSNGNKVSDNVIYIMLESFEWYAISSEFTPTLYALMGGYDFGTRDEVTGLYSNFNYYDFIKDETTGFTTLIRNDYERKEDENGNVEYIKKLDSQDKPIMPLSLSLLDSYGLSLTNYYSKTKTDYSEASAILGNYPYNDSFTTHGIVFESKNLFPDLDYSFSLPNVLKNIGTTEVTNYMHSYVSTFYGRDTMISEFGFDKTLFLDQMDSSIYKDLTDLDNAAKDSLIVDYYLNNPKSNYDFLPTDKSFLTFYTTVTTHGAYGYFEELGENYDFLDSVGYLGKTDPGIDITQDMEDSLRTYLASALDTEHAVTLIVKYLMENDMFDDTTIVLFADHQAYYDQMDVKYKQYYFSNDDEVGFSSPIEWERNLIQSERNVNYTDKSVDRYKVPACIYSTKINDSVINSMGRTTHKIDKFTCAFDLTPTIYTMLGVNYTTSYYFGYPVICDVYNEDSGEWQDLGVPAIISSTGGVFNDIIFTEDGSNKTCTYYRYINESDKDYKLKEFMQNVADYLEKMYKITALYKANLFK